MPEPLEKEPTRLYILSVVKYVNPQPEDPNLPVGWLPVFRTAEAAESYSGPHAEILEWVFTQVLRTN